MPPSRLEQCAYREGRRRCRRTGDGNPPLCAPHKIAAAEAARPQARTAIHDLFDTIMSGGRLRADDISAAAEEFLGGGFGGMGGNIAQGFHPDLSDEMPGDHQRAPHAAWEDFLRGSHRHNQAPPPPVDPDLERRAAVRAAKVALGFAAGEPITLEQVKKRHRELARKHHPDVGGSLAKMQEINQAAGILEAAL